MDAESISEYTLYIPSAVLLSSRMLGNVATLYESERPCCKKWAIKKIMNKSCGRNINKTVKINVRV